METRQKALTLNISTPCYGTIAEIGAGQEVAAHLFKVGGASSTIAKSISAYDMTFSDEIYGKEPSRRYVCESRLHKMLEREYQLLMTRLKTKKQENTLFFAFADTVAARSKTIQEAHGWMGINFQLSPQGEANRVILHVRILDPQNWLQQQTLGIIGINLIYACYYHTNHSEQFLLSLMDNLNNKRLEIDMIRATGPDLKEFDNHLLALWLVKHHFTDAVLFDSKGEVVQASEVFYKKNIFVLRGSYRPPTRVHLDMLKNGVQQFLKEENIQAELLVTLAEITLSNLYAEGELDERDFLARIDLLAALGKRSTV